MRERGLLHDRRHHRVRGRPADRARQLRLGELDEVRVRLDLPRGPEAALAGVAREGVVRLLGAEEAGEERAQVLDRDAAPPEERPGAHGGVLERVHEQRRLAVLDGALGGRQRDRDVGADVREHGPDHPVRDLVEAREPEELEGPQDLDAERSRLDEAHGDPPRPRERRDEERVEPHHEPGGEAGERAARASRPSRRARPGTRARTAPPRRRR